MYNRYVPQPDGSYQRNRMQESQRPAVPAAKQAPPPGTGGNSGFTESAASTASPPPCKSNPVQRKRQAQPLSAGSFLRQLLPGNLDTEDLLVVVLLLLMAGDCEEDRNNALLTLALYLFL